MTFDLIWIDIQVKELDKRASGQAFEVLLGDPTPDAKGDFPLAPPKKKDVSLEEIQRKLDAAEERRKVLYFISLFKCAFSQGGNMVSPCSVNVQLSLWKGTRSMRRMS